MSTSLATIARHPVRAAVILALALVALVAVTEVFGHEGTNTQHIGTDCGTATTTGCTDSSVEIVAGVEVDADLCARSADDHGSPGDAEGKDWDSPGVTALCAGGAARVGGISPDALINVNGAAPPQACPPNTSGALFWNKGPGILVCDLSAGTQDSAHRDQVFTKGSKQNEERNWSVATPGAPKKGDIDNAYLFFGEVEGSDTVVGECPDPPCDGGLTSGDSPIAIGDDVIVGAFSRTDRDGDSHDDFELRQSLCSGVDPDTLSSIDTCPRTEGDILITLDTEVEKIGNVTTDTVDVRVFAWEQCSGSPPTCTGTFDGDGNTGEGTDDCVLPSSLANTSGCWDLVPAAHPYIVGVTNFDNEAGSCKPSGCDAEYTDDEIEAGPWGSFSCERDSDVPTLTGCKLRTRHAGREFVEFAVNLTQLGLEPECPGFGTLLVKGRASTSLTAALKDVTPLISLDVNCSIAWEKRDGSLAGHPLQGGATFTVSGDPGPFACLDEDTDDDDLILDPTQKDEALLITVADGGPLDADGDAGQILLAGTCFGTYTITETAAPSGYAKDDDFTREVTIDANNKDVVVGTQGVDDDDNCDECDFHNRLGSLEWEKRDASVANHPLLKDARFQIEPNPYYCHGGTRTGTSTPAATPGSSSLIVHDDSLGGPQGAQDRDGDDGQFLVERVCLDTDGSAITYTITEIDPAPTGFAKDQDVDRTVEVSDTSPAGVGTVPLDDPPDDDDDDKRATHGIGTCGEPDDDCDFHNLRGSLIWEKRAKDASDTTALLCPSSTTAHCPLLGGATFSIDKNPHTGAVGPFAVIDCIAPSVHTDCDALQDKDRDAGQICIDQVKLNEPFQITETASPNSTKWQKSNATLNITLTLPSVCPNGTDAGDFINTPLSEIEVIFRSLAGPGVTIASIVCKDPSGTPIAAVNENGLIDPALDDFDEVFTALVPVTNIATDKYTCEIVIDP